MVFIRTRSAVFYHFLRKRGKKIMLKTLLLVIRGIILELVDQMLQKVCKLG